MARDGSQVFTHSQSAYLLNLQSKCDQYWPSRGTESYGVIHVTLLEVVELATYTMRTFQLAIVRNYLLTCSFISLVHVNLLSSSHCFMNFKGFLVLHKTVN